jgi:hypothetical protein
MKNSLRLNPRLFNLSSLEGVFGDGLKDREASQNTHLGRIGS